MKQNDTAKTLTVYDQGTAIAVGVERSVKAKRIRLRVSRRTGAVVLVLPRRASVEKGRDFAVSKSAWIAEQLRRLPPKRVFQDGMPLTFLGRDVVIRHSPAARRGVWSAGNVVWVSGAAEHLDRRVRDFLKSEFAAYALAKARETAAKIDAKVQKLTVRDTVSRWGSCSRTGHVSLSWRLGLAPLYVADYVIAHEIAHLAQMNHSAAFWRVVAGLCPDYERAEAWLKKNADYLYSFD